MPPFKPVKPKAPVAPSKPQTARRSATPLPVEVAPAPAPTIPSAQTLPGFYRRGASGVVSTTPGPGEQALDQVCTENGWAWGMVGTYTKDGRQVTAIIVGTIIEGEPPADSEPVSPLAQKRAEDAAMADVAHFLRTQYGGGYGALHRPARRSALDQKAPHYSRPGCWHRRPRVR